LEDVVDDSVHTLYIHKAHHGTSSAPYFDEAALDQEGLREAVMEGAPLRLRPKIMTVSTVVAGLLPIMWSTRTRAEVMKPHATPVLEGMVGSLLHALIVTPVIFTWLRERELSRKETISALLGEEYIQR
jgi:Cu(I)/Ag(I) efflux system membrane protein CusA/SilA